MDRYKEFAVDDVRFTAVPGEDLHSAELKALVLKLEDLLDNGDDQQMPLH